jgi:hypothetical protein
METYHIKNWSEGHSQKQQRVTWQSYPLSSSQHSVLTALPHTPRLSLRTVVELRSLGGRGEKYKFGSLLHNRLEKGSGDFGSLFNRHNCSVMETRVQWLTAVILPTREVELSVETSSGKRSVRRGSDMHL